MGHTTKISDYEMAHGDGPPPCEGVDIEAPAKTENPAPKVTKSKTVEPEKKPPVKKSAPARTKAK